MTNHQQKENPVTASITVLFAGLVFFFLLVVGLLFVSFGFLSSYKESSFSHEKDGKMEKNRVAEEVEYISPAAETEAIELKDGEILPLDTEQK